MFTMDDIHDTERPTQAIQTELVGDDDAQTMVITSLRSQIQDLFSQVTQLNTKLVKSYDRVSDLEDELHVASSNLRTSSLKVSQLELERTQHLAALNTGLLVEKSHVTAELTRLMEKATDEAAQRGQAESARADIEKELDDLSANLFEQANSMVAEARLARALSERKVEEAEAVLKGAEEAVGVMQKQMQVLGSEKEEAERCAENMRALVGKGKWPAREPSPAANIQKPLKLPSSHLPYSEFLLFIAHLRSIHLSSSHPPAIPTLLPLPFLARLQAEDSEPTIRLDIAPSLNWLSRRSVLAAVHTGQLTIEPVAASALHEIFPTHSSTPIVPGTGSGNANVSCALCGTPLFHYASDKAGPRLMPRMNASGMNGVSSWSANLFRNPLSYTQSGSVYESPPPTPPADSRSSSPSPPSTSQQVYIFRVSSAIQTPGSTLGLSLSTSLPLTSSSLSVSSQQPPNSSHISPQGRGTASIYYPLCTSGWCLARLRTTCSLWAFVRTGIIEKVWEEEVPILPPPPPKKEIVNKSNAAAPPPVPPRRRGLWGMASALSERAASWGEGDKGSKDKEKDKKLAAPPSSRLSLDMKWRSANVTPPAQSVTPPPQPPPVPKRAEGRARELSAPQTDASVSVRATREDTKGATESSQVPPLVPSPGEDQGPNTPRRLSVTRKLPPPIDGPPSITEDAAMTMGTITTPETTKQQSHHTTDITSDSEDGFKTPPEEPANTPALATVEQESDPIKVPLPESRTTTPVAASFAQASQLPADAVKLKRLSKGGAVDVGASVGANGAAPPPLPRRAAARTARGGAIVPPPTHSRSASAASIRANVVGSSTEVVVAAAPAPAPTATATAPAPDTSPTPAASTAPAIGAEAVSQPRSVKDTGEEGRQSVDKGKKEAEVTSVAETRRSSVLSVSVYSGTGKDSILEPEPSSIHAILGTQGKAVGDKNASTGVHHHEDDRERDGGQVYIGDATWEERAWKELVRLKEEMFLARIGGLR